MRIASFFEWALMGKGAARERREIDQKISEERADLNRRQQELTADVRQHEQISNSATRVMHTMTQAMVMMEARRGRPQR